MNKTFAVGMAVALALTGSAAQAATNLILNGDFEGFAPGFALPTDPGSAWTVEGMVGVGNGTPAVYGGCCNVEGLNPLTNQFAAFGWGDIGTTNSISQTLTTVLGKKYVFSFQAGALAGGSASHPFTVKVNADVFAPDSVSTGNPTFVSYAYSFFGTGSDTVSFSAAGVGSVDAVLDNVSVTAVPEPSSWALMILGFGSIGAAMRNRRRTTQLA